MADLTLEELIQKNEDLQSRLDTAEEALRAIQSGEVDALVIYGEEGERIYTLEGADSTYRVMVEKIQEGVATLQPDGMILYANQRLAEMLETPLENLLGSTLLPYLQLQDQKIYQGLLHKGAEGTSRGELTIYLRNGSTIPVLLSMNCVENAGRSGQKGEKVICLVASDLTEQKRQEEILASERLARSILEQAAEAIIVCDTRGTIIRASQAAYAVVKDNPLFQPFESAFPLVIEGSGQPAQRFSIGEVLQGRSFQGLETRLAANAACAETEMPAHYLLLSAAPLRNDRDAVIGCVVTLSDFTDRKQGEQRIAAEREWFRTTLASIGDAVITTDPKERVTYLNSIAEQLTGWTNADAAGLPMEQVFPIINEQTGQPVGNPVGSVLHSGKIVGLANHTALRSRDGRIIPIEDSAAPIRDAEGQVLGVIMVFHDMTQKRQAEEALLHSELRYRSLVENSQDGILLTQPNGSILSANTQACKMFGMTEAELIAAGRDGITVQDERLGQALAQRERTGKIRAEFTERRKDGTTFIADVSSGVFTDADGTQKTSVIIRDITQQKQIEAEREQLLVEISSQNALLEQLVQTAPLGIAILSDPEHRFILANPAQQKLFPTIGEFVGRTVAEIWPEQKETFTPILDRVYQTGEPYYAVDAPWQTDHGHGFEEAFYTFSYTPLRTVDGSINGILVLSIETTEQVKARRQIEAELVERQRMEAHLRESQERLLMTTEGVEIGLWDWDLVQDMLLWDTRCKALFGQPSDAVWGYPNFIQSVHPEDRALVEVAVQSALAGRTIYEVEFRTVWPDESIHWIYAKGQASYNDAGTPVRMVGIALDINARKLAEAEIRMNQAHIEVQHRLIEQREQERQQIARDLHDGPVQALIGATFAMQSLRIADLTPEVSQKLEALRVTLQEQIGELRAYAGELRPPMLARFGLVKAIQALLETFAEKHPEIQFHLDEHSEGPLLPEEIRLALFRITQETMNNIVKHAQASQVTIRFWKTPDQVILEILDNGIGFTIPQDWLELARQRHLGLVGMRERAEALGGKLQISSRPGQGTQVRVVVPI